MLPEPIREILSNSVTDVFFLGLFVVVAAVIVTLFIPVLPMRDMAAMRAAMAKDKETEEAVAAGDAHL